ncbi:MAG: aldo/keto reductase [Gemmatimonadota bacterium]
MSPSHRAAAPPTAQVGSRPAIPQTELAPGYRIPRLVVGGWQLSHGHRGAPREPAEAVETLVALADRGLTAFDCADIYTGVEELFGRFLRRWRTTSTGGNPAGGAGASIQIHTKLVPDWSHLPHVDEAYVRGVVERSLRRLGVETLDLVQLYWWDLERGDWLAAGRALGRLQQEGKIRHLGVTNFTAAEVETLEREADIHLLSNQVQYSALDRRPEHNLTYHCAVSGLHLLTYGALAGGFLTGSWLGKKDPTQASSPAESQERPDESSGDPGFPSPQALASLPNRSLIKYRLIIQEFGGWEPYQALLRELVDIGTTHGVGPAPVALRFVLDQPEVAAALVGFSSLSRMEENLRALTLQLTPEDHARIRRHTQEAPGPQGDIFALERDRQGPHGRIMKYEENG